MFDADIAYHAAVRPRAPAFLTPRRSATYRELNDDVNRFAAALRELGVSRSSGVVAVETSQIYRAHVYMLALARLGVASGLAADGLVDLRISERVGETAPGVLRLTADWLARVQAAPPTPIQSAPRERNDLARVLLTSGTTGSPRRVPLTWGLIADSGANALTVYAAGRLGTWVLSTGTGSSMGFNLATLAWSMGACVAVGHSVADLPPLMERQPSGLMAMAAPHLATLVRHLPAGFEPRNDWRFVVTGGAVPTAVARDALKRLGSDILVNYGSTEVGRMFVGHARILEDHPGAVGWPVPGVVAEIMGPDTAPVLDGEVGELRIRSERSAGAYLGAAEDSNQAFRDGWFHPGDLARRVPDTGLYVIEGRIDERMNVAGLKFLPHVLENAIIEHPQVLDAAAFAAPGPDGLDQCWIAVVVDGDIAREALLATLAAVPGPRPPIRFAWAEAIPRNIMGKIDRVLLRQQTLAALEQSPR